MNRQKLFDYMSQEHGVSLLETDMIEIENIVMSDVSGSLGYDKGYEQGYNDATTEACQEIAKNYQPNNH